MATKLNTLQELKDFLDGVSERADHHAKGVESVAIALAGGLIAYSDSLQDIRFRKNILWTKINGNEYVFAYNHNTKEIEFRERNQLGKVLHTFTDTTSNLQSILAFFKSL